MRQVMPVMPAGEAIRKAVRWISEQGCWDLRTVGESAWRFDLSPQEEEVLVRHFIRQEGIAQ